MRNIKELILLVIAHIPQERNFYGLCSSVDEIWLNGDISSEESKRLIYYFRENRPFSSIVNSSLYWWPVGEKQPRLDFLSDLLREIYLEENKLEKPTKEQFGWIENTGFDSEPSGFAHEGGEEAYDEALKKWEFMVEKGLGPEDMINDITYPHEL